ncbi:MAG: hypothetical protein ABFQ95_01080 [Pseudomonadota bacterium]
MPRGRPKKDQTQVLEDPIQVHGEPIPDKQIVSVEVKEAIDLRTLPLETIDDYKKYANEARNQKRPIRFIPSEMYPSQKIKFRRVDNQKGSDAKIRFRSGKYLIDFKREIKDSEVLELPIPVIDYINSRQVDKYKQVKYPDGSSETVYSHSEPRFSCQPVYEG